MSILKHVWSESPAADSVWSQVAGMRPQSAEAKRFMVLQAYIDDSSDDESGIYVLAGYLSSAEKWSRFSKEWEERLPLSVIQPNGRYRFKMSEMSKMGRMGNVSAFHTVINEHADLSIACVLNKNDVYEAFSRLEAAYIDTAANKNILGISQFVENVASPFTVAFSHITYRLLSVCSTGIDGVDGVDGLTFNNPLDFYFDDTPEKHVIRQKWDYYISTASAEMRTFVGAEPRFEDDEVFLPIQAADFRAWWVAHWAKELGPENVLKGKYPFKTGAKRILNLAVYVSRDDVLSFALNGLRNSIIEGGLLFTPDYGEPFQIKFKSDDPSLLVYFR